MTAFFFSRILPMTLAGSAVSLALLLLTPLTRRKFSSRWQYYSWAVALLLFAVPFAIRSPAPAAPVRAIPPPIEFITDFMEPAAFFPQMETPVFTLPWRELLAAVWLAGAAVYLLNKLFAAARFSGALRRASKPIADFETISLFEDCKRALRVRGRIELVSCPPVCAPMLVGILRPRVILPETALSADELRLVFLHELTHYRHGDLLYKLTALLVNAVHWFNPLSWMIARRLNALCELACDESLSRAMKLEERRGYGMAILTVMGEARLAPPVSTSFSLKKEDVKRRLDLIMNYKKPTRALLLAGICAIALLTFVGVSVSAYVLPTNGEVLAASSGAERNASSSIPRKVPATAKSVTIPAPAAASSSVSDAASASLTEEQQAKKLVDQLRDSVKFDEKQFSFTIPKEPVGETWVIHAAGRQKMGSDAMSVHWFETESAERSWKAGKTYTANFDPSATLELTVEITLLGKDGSELATGGAMWIPAAALPFDGKLYYPVDGAKQSVGFQGYRGHVGVDFLKSGIMGQEIHAVADGTLVSADWGGAYGKRVIIDHGGSTQTLYAQCDELKVSMSKDGSPVVVKKGDVIATVGRTGNVTGPHLHFELRVHGTAIDPAPYFSGDSAKKPYLNYVF